MSANEDPAAPSNAEAPADQLEDWLSDLRTEVAADPSGWIGEEPAENHPATHPASHPAAHPATGPAAPPPAPPAEPTRIGRHRAPDQ